MKQAYPTFILDTKDNSPHPFLVCVPDMEILTEGDTFTDAIEMARDAIGLSGICLEDEKREIPTPSDQETVRGKIKDCTEDIDFTKGVLTYVDVDFTEYRKKNDNKAVRRNVTLPNWLNYEAEKAGINVSRVLQDALISVLGVKREI